MTANNVDRSKGHQRIDHEFNFELFDYDAPENFQRMSSGRFCQLEASWG